MLETLAIAPGHYGDVEFMQGAHPSARLGTLVLQSIVAHIRLTITHIVDL